MARKKWLTFGSSFSQTNKLSGDWFQVKGLDSSGATSISVLQETWYPCADWGFWAGQWCFRHGNSLGTWSKQVFGSSCDFGVNAQCQTLLQAGLGRRETPPVFGTAVMYYLSVRIRFAEFSNSPNLASDSHFTAAAHPIALASAWVRAERRQDSWTQPGILHQFPLGKQHGQR